MDTELLKTFLEVSKTRHFGRAAEALYLTQSAVSFRIRQLENQLGVNLFTRHRNNIRLTAAGERLLPYAENLMSTWLMAKKEVAHTQQHHELSIGASASLWETCLTPWLQKLYEKHENLHIEARIAQRNSLVKQLHERQLDLLIATEAPKMDELASQQIGHIALSLFRSRKSNKNEKYQYIRMDWGADFHQHAGFLAGADDVPVLSTTSAHLTRQLLHTTGACAFLPETWGKEYSDLMVVPDTAIARRPLFAVWLGNSDQQAHIRQLLRFPVNSQS
ncbi:HTH-type transcriptional regulator HdfR [Erwinia amylovora]|uniref:HTH-type transcriptional regulator HdfR n=4 Tax=Erwinia amylovora TaxID=552 RepID=A0A830ZS21_ERWAM|nr:HTH-type transcriptional regulator HdfR [Erwinia amylovora]CBX78970.1 probable RuBisCO transcriptional regulator [Erwinia amylovora ATCC BAA-2158]CCP01262.1 putative RuBisCO transcriptional regulator [Erwinia amylovora Ea644]CDK13775.1 putative RuBisCO transcriptional regulator [Erwinia amylovora LA635]CDK17142.1 putative RuBisCO transcriptional regulator [Erwinia amylovora LA636]CDK20511.1 putative RuBisCO transcriptional regulator [Erwinia amylovora LA637]